jgi:hypothetical protein
MKLWMTLRKGKGGKNETIHHRQRNRHRHITISRNRPPSLAKGRALRDILLTLPLKGTTCPMGTIRTINLLQAEDHTPRIMACMVRFADLRIRTALVPTPIRLLTTTGVVPGVLTITTGDHLRLITIKCRRCLTQVSRTIMVRQAGTMVILLAYLDVLEPLQATIPDTVRLTLDILHTWDITVDLLRLPTIPPMGLRIRVLFLRQGANDRASRILHPTALGRNELLMVSAMIPATAATTTRVFSTNEQQFE